MKMTEPSRDPLLFHRNESDESWTAGRRKFSKVLLVDDSKFLADILAMFFELDGYSARAAYGGHEAIAAVEEDMPDIAFIDLDMPDMNGLDLARRIRASQHARVTLLVALSGWDEEQHKQDAAEAGFDHFLAKPVGAPAIREFMAWLSTGE
ncbi:MAG: response regulator [Verrucomicrobiota bacterium]